LPKTAFQESTIIIITIIIIIIIIIQNGSGTHPASYPISTRGSLPGGKAAGA
jgi:hypothetical protein